MTATHHFTLEISVKMQKPTFFYLFLVSLSAVALLF